MSSGHLKLMENIEDRLYRYRAKRLRFLINGDKFFNGINYALNTEKTRSFDSLLNELTRSLMDHIKLCKGVRFIFDLDGKIVTNLIEFQDGSTYICSSTDNFISMDYKLNVGPLNWLVRNSASISSSGNVLARSKRNNNQIANTSQQHNQTLNKSLQLQQSHHQHSESLNVKTASHNGNHSSNSSDDNGKNLNNHDNNNRNSQSIATKPPMLDLEPNHQNQSSKAKSPSQPKRNAATSYNNKLSQINNSSNTPKQEQQNKFKKAIKTNNDSNYNNNASNKFKTTPNNKHNDSISENPLNQIVSTPKDNNDPTTTFGSEVREKYDIGKPIGDGHFSVVYCCMNKTTQEFCALKLIDKLKCRGRDDMIYNEVKILKRLDHPNIVKLIEEFDYSKQLYLILELVQDGDLFDAITTVRKFDEIHVATMLYNLSSALSYLHNHGIVHRDIKPENLLISVQEDGSQSVKLADFGLAVEVGDNPLYSVCGTAFYVSPEMLNETGYDFKVDVWSTGVICFILLCGYPPFATENESNQDELFDAILAGDFQFAPSYWSKISQHAKNLIRCMLTVDPNQRYTADQVFNHPWTMGTSSNFDGINPMNMSRRIAHQSQ